MRIISGDSHSRVPNSIFEYIHTNISYICMCLCMYLYIILVLLTHTKYKKFTVLSVSKFHLSYANRTPVFCRKTDPKLNRIKKKSRKPFRKWPWVGKIQFSTIWKILGCQVFLRRGGRRTEGSIDWWIARVLNSLHRLSYCILKNLTSLVWLFLLYEWRN